MDSILIFGAIFVVVALLIMAYAIVLQRKSVGTQDNAMDRVQYSIQLQEESIERMKRSVELQEQAIGMSQESFALQKESNALLQELITLLGKRQEEQ